MKRLLIVLVVLALTAVGLALSYQEAAKDRDYRNLLARGDTALRDDQTFGAIEAYSGAIALRPDSMLAYLRRGESYQRRGELESAARDFQTAAARDPTATRPLDELGDVRYLQQRFANAADTYERYLRLDDRAAQVGYKLALARYRDGNLDAALSALDAVLRLDDRSADAYYLRGLCLRDRRQLTAARKALERAVALSPGSIPAREELADLTRRWAGAATSWNSSRSSPGWIATGWNRRLPSASRTPDGRPTRRRHPRGAPDMKISPC